MARVTPSRGIWSGVGPVAGEGAAVPRMAGVPADPPGLDLVADGPDDTLPGDLVGLRAGVGEGLDVLAGAAQVQPDGVVLGRGDDQQAAVAGADRADRLGHLAG